MAAAAASVPTRLMKMRSMKIWTVTKLLLRTSGADRAISSR